MIKILHEDKNAEILVITPLLTGHEISDYTTKTIKTSTIPYIWVSYEDKYKHAKNVQMGLNEYKKQYGNLPKYIQVLDRDIVLGRKFLDRMYDVINISPTNYAFTFCSFQYSGYINMAFRAVPFSHEHLKKGNYISSNSMYKSEAIEKVGGFVTEEKYHRLSDWAFFRKLCQYNYIGQPCYTTSFTAISTEKDISAGGQDEYVETYRLIIKDFPI